MIETLQRLACNYLQSNALTTEASIKTHVNALTTTALTAMTRKLFIIILVSALGSAQNGVATADPSL